VQTSVNKGKKVKTIGKECKRMVNEWNKKKL